MMPHDDSDLRLLERDLGRIARPRDGDERIRLAVREQLAGRMRPRPRRRLSVRIAIGSTALAGATAAIALVVLVATNGSEGPAVANAAIVHHALKAVTPLRHKVLHVKVVGVQNGVPVMAETWQETSAPYAIRGIKGGGGHVGEFGDNGTTSFRYDAGSNTIYEHPDSSHLTFTDPISRVRHELASGQAHVAGTVVIHGTSLYKIDLRRGLVVYFDKRDYRPRYLDDTQRDGSVVRLRVAAYQYLPMTASNRALFSVTAEHPRARIAVSSNGELGK